jgi:hypothetical protein
MVSEVERAFFKFVRNEICWYLYRFDLIGSKAEPTDISITKLPLYAEVYGKSILPPISVDPLLPETPSLREPTLGNNH